MSWLLALIASWFTFFSVSCGSGISDSMVSSNESMPEVVMGLSHACARLTDGTVWCWGDNASGQLGDGNSPSPSISPVKVVGLPAGGATQITGGEAYTCAIVNGGAWCWGANGAGQLGDGTTNNRPTPVQVLGLTSGVEKIAAGDVHTCAIVNGGAKCWGSDSNDQLGLGATDQSISVPQDLVGLSSGVTDISAGDLFTCAVAGGAAKCWGFDGSGELGNDTGGNQDSPGPVFGLSSGVTRIAAGGAHACAIVNGGAKCWGSHNAGQTGDGSGIGGSKETPVDVVGASQVTDIAAGDGHACFVKNGAAHCWGDNLSGQLGDGSSPTDSSAPKAVFGLENGVENIRAQDGNTCAVVNGKGMCWGSDTNGQLGNGAPLTNEDKPQLILSLF